VVDIIYNNKLLGEVIRKSALPEDFLKTMHEALAG